MLNSFSCINTRVINKNEPNSAPKINTIIITKTIHTIGPRLFITTIVVFGLGTYVLCRLLAYSARWNNNKVQSVLDERQTVRPIMPTNDSMNCFSINGTFTFTKSGVQCESKLCKIFCVKFYRYEEGTGLLAGRGIVP